MQLISGNGNCIKGFSLNDERQLIALCWRLNSNNKKDFYLSLTSKASFKGFGVQ